MRFQLHHRWVPLASEATSAPGRVAFVLHGALGSGQNFRGFVQRLAALRTDYRFVLVDLRCHGESTGAPAPHTLAACAEDLSKLSRHLGVVPQVLIGHSLGGKVALQYAQQAESLGEQSQSGLEQVWILDAVPGKQPEAEDSEVSHVIRAVRRVPMPAASRRAVVQYLTSEEGLSNGLAEWMATNLRRVGAEFSWRFDLDGIEQLMADYFQVDLWDYLFQARNFPQIELVVAERSSRWTSSLRARAAGLAVGARATSRILANAGHWVHVDNPDGLLAMLAESLVSSP